MGEQLHTKQQHSGSASPGSRPATVTVRGVAALALGIAENAEDPEIDGQEKFGARDILRCAYSGPKNCSLKAGSCDKPYVKNV
jgi:hypothetical protein